VLLHSLWGYLWHGRDFRLRSRWMLVIDAVRHASNHLLRREHAHPHEIGAETLKPAAFGIGLLHGISAETGSQALLLASMAGASTAGVASAVLFAFIGGLLVSNTAVALMSIAGFNAWKRSKPFAAAIGAAAILFSLAVGIVFLTGNASSLPELL